jgi:hypothetical protein
MSHFFECTIWDRQRQTSAPASINLELVTRVTVGEDGRAVVYLADGGSFTADSLYPDFCRDVGSAR